MRVLIQAIFKSTIHESNIFIFIDTKRTKYAKYIALFDTFNPNHAFCVEMLSIGQVGSYI
jgi:hypothetical protein